MDVLNSLNKSFTLSQTQFNGLVFGHRLVGKMIEQASPEDDTPLALNIMEVLHIVGEEVMSMGKQK